MVNRGRTSEEGCELVPASTPLSSVGSRELWPLLSVAVEIEAIVGQWRERTICEEGERGRAGEWGQAWHSSGSRCSHKPRHGRIAGRKTGGGSRVDYDVRNYIEKHIVWLHLDACTFDELNFSLPKG